jgi:hypothetical protein
MTIPVIPVSSMGTHATQDIKVDDDVEAEVKQDLSLASSIGSSNPVTVCDIRTLANNYQKMLMQATKEIKKLNSDLHRLQQDQAKLLEANVELALETKTLLLEQKKWKKDEQVEHRTIYSAHYNINHIFVKLNYNFSGLDSCK